MAIQSMVAVFGETAQESGEPDRNQVGTGSLILPDRVLVHPDLAYDLVAGVHHEPLGVCITTWAGARPECEFLDVAEVVVGGQQRGEPGAEAWLETTRRQLPVVELRLSAESTIEPSPQLSSYDDLQRFLADPFNGPAAEDGGDNDPNPFCKFLGIFC